MKNTSWLLMIGVCALVVGCGGGDYIAPPPAVTDEVPASASESSAGLASYLMALSAAAADDKEPLDLSKFAPKVPDDTEPETLR